MAFIANRILSGAFVVLMVVVFVFFLVRLSGDPVLAVAGEFATAEEISVLRSTLGYDAPVIVQLGRFLARAVQGDFGTSLKSAHVPVMELIGARLWPTVSLVLFAQMIALLVIIPIGLVSAMWPNSPVDLFGRGLAVVGQCMPIFWLGILLIQLFAVRWQLLPAYGTGSTYHLILPALTIAGYSIPHPLRVLRSSLVEVLQSDYVRTARSKGLRDVSVVLRHGLRNAAIPALTVFGLRLGVILGGTVVTEKVFAYPGLGLLALDAISARDYPVVQAFVVISAVIIVTMNIFVDVMYGFLDPRIKVS